MQRALIMLCATGYHSLAIKPAPISPIVFTGPYLTLEQKQWPGSRTLTRVFGESTPQVPKMLQFLKSCRHPTEIAEDQFRNELTARELKDPGPLAAAFTKRNAAQGAFAQVFRHPQCRQEPMSIRSDNCPQQVSDALQHTRKAKPYFWALVSSKNK